ncbi:flavodoxin family protein [Chloroflexota bacterium]
MKIIGFSAGVVGRDSNTDRMVKAIIEKSGYDSEFVKLNDLDYSACRGCVWLCAGPQVCRLGDDLLPHYQKVKEADAVVLGSPIHHGTVSASMLAFISRLWGFRHVNFAIEDKPFVLALCGIGRWQDTAEEDFRRALRSPRVKIADVVRYSSAIPPCYTCGRHQECSIGGAYRIWADEAHTLEITPDLFRRWEDDPETVARVEASAARLRDIQADHMLKPEQGQA